MSPTLTLPKATLQGTGISICTYESVTTYVLETAAAAEAACVTALAVHGLVESWRDPDLQTELSTFGAVTPDGQPVRWALNVLHGAGLGERVYGPTLMLRICEGAAERGIPILLYGTTADTLGRLASSLRTRCNQLNIVGTMPSLFRRANDDEISQIVGQIRSSGARVVFIGIGCPRQERLAFRLARDAHVVAVAVGAAFDYHAGLRKEPAAWIMRFGMQWAYRLATDPKRTWRRYFSTNPDFVFWCLAQKLGRVRRKPSRTSHPEGTWA